jgi:hypothetical protein
MNTKARFRGGSCDLDTTLQAQELSDTPSDNNATDDTFIDSQLQRQNFAFTPSVLTL